MTKIISRWVRALLSFVLILPSFGTLHAAFSSTDGLHRTSLPTITSVLAIQTLAEPAFSPRQSELRIRVAQLYEQLEAMGGLQSSRLDLMKPMFLLLKNEYLANPEAIWETVRRFLATFYKGNLVHDQNANADQLTRSESERKKERAFLRWARKEASHDGILAIVMAIIDIQLYGLPLIDRGYQHDTREAFRTLAEQGAYQVLVSMVDQLHADFINLASAWDALRSMTTDDSGYWDKFAARFATILSPEKEIASTPAALPLMARLGITKFDPLVRNVAILVRVQERLGLPNLQTAETALRLLTFQDDVPMISVQGLLRALVEANDRRQGQPDAFVPKPVDLDLYVMVCMLAELHVHRFSRAGRASLTPNKIKRLREEITTRHWSAPEYGFQYSVTVAKMAGQLGELLQSAFIQGHENPTDSAVTVLLGYFFEMHIKELTGVIERGELTHPALLETQAIAKARKAGVVRGSAAIAARYQFSVICQALAQFHRNDFSWDMAYRLAYWEVHEDKEPATLSLLAEKTLDLFGQPGPPKRTRPNNKQERQKVKAEQELNKKGSWTLHIPESLEIRVPEHESEPVIYPPLSKRISEMTADEIWEEWEAIVRLMFPEEEENRHFTARAKRPFNKFQVLVDQFEDLEALALHQKPKRDIGIYQFEIDPTQFCNMACTHCRLEDGIGLRDVPLYMQKLSGELMIKKVEEAYETNPGKMVVRISSVIGEPLTNVGTLMLMEHLNKRGIPYGVITNGLIPYAGQRTNIVNWPERWDWFLYYAFAPNSAMEFFNISVDAGNEEDHAKKRPKGGFFQGLSYAYVTENGGRGVQVRNATHTEIGISFSAVISEENYKNLDKLVERGKELGVDLVQLKALNLDRRKFMWPESVRYLYEERRKDINALQDDQFKVGWLLDFKTAKERNDAARLGQGVRQVVLYDKNGKAIQPEKPFISSIADDIEICPVGIFANVLGPGLNAQGLPTAFLKSCRNAYEREGVLGTLPHLGDAVENSIGALRLKRQRELYEPENNVQKNCIDCPPSDGPLVRAMKLIAAGTKIRGFNAAVNKYIQRNSYIADLRWEESRRRRNMRRAS